MSTFDLLGKANAIRQKEWDKERRIDLSYRGNELAGETGEACNKIKKLERERLGIPGSRTTKEELAEELADVVMCVSLIANHIGFDLWVAVANKFNKTSENYGLKTKIKFQEDDWFVDNGAESLVK